MRETNTVYRPVVQRIQGLEMTTLQESAMRKALNALSCIEYDAFGVIEGPSDDTTANAIATLKAALAQQREQPVAFCTIEPLRGDESQRRHYVKWVGQPVAGPLYTAAYAPQQAQQVEPNIQNYLEKDN